jgi:hypothetical protein
VDSAESFWDPATFLFKEVLNLWVSLQHLISWPAKKCYDLPKGCCDNGQFIRMGRIYQKNKTFY